MKGINRYIDNSIARTRTVGILIKCIEILLKYSSPTMPLKYRHFAEQCLAEYEYAITDKKGGGRGNFRRNTKWASEDYI